MINLENVLLRGSRASQPAAASTAEGSLYFVTDEGVTEQVRSAAWVAYSSASSALTSGQVLSGNIASGQVGGFHLSSGSITSGRIASGQIGSFHLSSGCIVSGRIASGQIGANHLASGVLTAGGTSILVQRTYDSYTTNADLSTAIPGDNTIPQITEGTEIIARAFTASSATNRLRFTFIGGGAPSTQTYCTVALFTSGTANALAGAVNAQAGTFIQPLCMIYEQVAGTTNPQSFSIRTGPAAGVYRMNGDNSNRFLGGVMGAVLTIEELIP